MERFPPGGRFPYDLTPNDRLSGEQVRSLMRKYQVTIRQVADALQITQKRVREVRGNGVEGIAYVWDWYEAITEIYPKIRREIHEGLEDVRSGRTADADNRFLKETEQMPVADGLPEDLAEQHDRYRYGLPKKPCRTKGSTRS
jgi:hypothetical protein